MSIFTTLLLVFILLSCSASLFYALWALYQDIPPTLEEEISAEQYNELIEFLYSFETILAKRPKDTKVYALICDLAWDISWHIEFNHKITKTKYNDLIQQIRALEQSL